jgi:hypothetical protein
MLVPEEDVGLVHDPADAAERNERYFQVSAACEFVLGGCVQFDAVLGSFVPYGSGSVRGCSLSLHLPKGCDPFQ